MAQLGEIPADVVPVIISEKARMAQEQAQRQASAQGGQQTVIDRAMQTNANAEAGIPVPPQQPPQGGPGIPQAMPQGMPAQQALQGAPQGIPQGAPQQAPQGAPPQGMAAGGLANIPVDRMFNDQNFQTGGIVALAGGGSDFTPESDPGSFSAGIRNTTDAGTADNDV